MTALLGLLAVAGFQNREKISEMLRGLTNPQGGSGQAGHGQMGGQSGQSHSGQQGGLGGILDNLTGGSQGGMGGGLGGLAGGLGGLLGGGASAGGVLSGGLGGLLDQFRQNGYADKAESWVQTGPNQDIDDTQLSQALGPDVLQELTARTGLSQQELLSRLSRELPRAVDGLTPDGRIPPEGQM
jgi:uncharacterized protein YidB (DUF937 family)